MHINLSLTYISPTIPSMACTDVIGAKINISIHRWMELDIDLQCRLCTLNQRWGEKKSMNWHSFISQ